MQGARPDAWETLSMAVRVRNGSPESDVHRRALAASSLFPRTSLRTWFGSRFRIDRFTSESFHHALSSHDCHVKQLLGCYDDSRLLGSQKADVHKEEG